MNTASAKASQALQDPKNNHFITSGEVDKMDAAMLAAEIQNGRKLCGTGQKLAKLRKLLPN